MKRKMLFVLYFTMPPHLTKVDPSLFRCATVWESDLFSISSAVGESQLLSFSPRHSSRKLSCLFYHDAVQESYSVSFTTTQFKKVILSLLPIRSSRKLSCLLHHAAIRAWSEDLSSHSTTVEESDVVFYHMSLCFPTSHMKKLNLYFTLPQLKTLWNIVYLITP